MCVCVGEWVRVCGVCESGWVSGCEFVVREIVGEWVRVCGVCERVCVGEWLRVCGVCGREREWVRVCGV